MLKKHTDESLERYYESIAAIPLLTAEEEVALSKRIKQGDPTAKEKLIRTNLRLVITIARQYSTRGITFMDMVQEGNIGLMRAAEKFDHKREVRFSTYAVWWIKQYISRFLSTRSTDIKLPHRKSLALQKVKKAAQALSQTLMREPAVEEIAADVHLPIKEVYRLYAIPNDALTLEGNQDALGVIDTLQDYTYNPERQVLKQESENETFKILNRLQPRERWVLMHRYQLKGYKRYTLRALAEKCNLSAETVRQIEARALQTMRVYAEELQASRYEEAI